MLEVFGQEENNNDKKYDIILLSQSYPSEFFTDELVSEILNTGTATIKAVEITEIFYNEESLD